MDFNEAIKAHSSWKINLLRYISEPDGSIKVNDVRSDKLCRLGAWLYESQEQFKDLPEFSEVIATHKKFHNCAANIVAKADSGEGQTEEVTFGHDSEYNDLSNALVKQLVRLEIIV